MDFLPDSEEEELFDDIMVELMDLRKKQLNCRAKLTILIAKIEKYSGMYPYIWVFIILYPDLLLIFLQTRDYIGSREYSSAIARCIQHHKKAEGERDDWYKDSLNYLLKFKDKVRGIIELKILPGRYPIDIFLYQLVVENNISDPHYDKSQSHYSYRGPCLLDKAYIYYGHRDCYHALLYGDDIIKQTYIKLAIKNDDCITVAIREFIGVAKEVDIRKAIELYYK